MQQKSLDQAENELRELVGMRVRSLITDEIFLKEKPELEKKIAQMKEKLKNVEASNEKWIELTERTFRFATYARKAFLLGGLEPKREILMTLGETIVIKNKKLDIKPYEWFEIIAKEYPPIQEEYLRLEPGKRGDFRNKTDENEALNSIRTTWRTPSVWYQDFRNKSGDSGDLIAEPARSGLL